MSEPTPPVDTIAMEREIMKLFEELAKVNRDAARKLLNKLPERLPAADVKDTTDRMAKFAPGAAGKLAGINPMENPRFAARAAAHNAEDAAERAKEAREAKAKADAKAAVKPNASPNASKPAAGGGVAAMRAKLAKKMAGGQSDEDEPKSPKMPKKP
jgi:hypothetical protein